MGAKRLESEKDRREQHKFEDLGALETPRMTSSTCSESYCEQRNEGNEQEGSDWKEGGRREDCQEGGERERESA